MTVGASGAQRLETNDLLASSSLPWVAGETGDGAVRPFEAVGRIAIVIEPVQSPAGIVVAALAGRSYLTEMRIGVTARAGGRRAAERHLARRRPGARRRSGKRGTRRFERTPNGGDVARVAGEAGEGAVPAGERELRAPVVEPNRAPRRQVVAVEAASGARSLDGRAGVRIAVAIGAAGAGESELKKLRGRGLATGGLDRRERDPRALELGAHQGAVAGHAVGCEMRSEEGEGRRLVRRRGEGRGPELRGRVTLLALSGARAARELAGVRVGMTGRATIEALDPCRLPGRVTGGAGGREMLAGERIARLSVVEVRGLDALPVVGGVAALATGAEASLVRILVAGATSRRGAAIGHGCGRVRGVLRLGPRVSMAAGTGDLDVPQGERKLRSRVVEELGRPKLRLPVAARAVRTGELSAVNVGVAALTAAVEAEEGASEIDLVRDQRAWIWNRLLAMTGPAGERGVSAPEFVAALSMLEGALSLLPPEDQFERPPLMVDMAALAVAVIAPRMEAASRLDPFGDRRVAGQAPRPVDTVLSAVALQASVAAIEIRMRAAQLAGRDLGGGRENRDQRRDEAGEREPERCRPAELSERAERAERSQCPILA